MPDRLPHARTARAACRLAALLLVALAASPPAAAEVPTPDPGADPGEGPGEGVVGGRIDVNAASAAALAAALPGVGPVKAAAIVAHREANGAFASPDALVEVRGIGPKTLERLRPLIGVGAVLEGRHRDAERRARAAIGRVVGAARRGRQ